MAGSHNLSTGSVFSSWQALSTHAESHFAATGQRLADGVIVAVQDHMHCEVVCKFANLGYDILCEKPLGVSVKECVTMAEAVEEAAILCK